jgi:predicted alpha/beta superfamily hydrolase
MKCIRPVCIKHIIFSSSNSLHCEARLPAQARRQPKLQQTVDTSGGSSSSSSSSSSSKQQQQQQQQQQQRGAKSNLPAAELNIE